MDNALLSTISALAGTAIGAFSSFGTTWVSVTSQARAARLAAERGKREEVYGRFMDELARLYAAALNQVGIDYEKLTTLFALHGRINLYGNPVVVAEAERAMRFIVDLSLSPTRSPEEVRAMMDRPDANVIGAFAAAARQELNAIG